MAASNVSKTFVRPDNTAVITCPVCGLQKTINIATFEQHKHALKIKCGCKNIFTVNLEFRKKIRKRTHLRGNYINHSQGDRRGSLIVTNVSLSGLEFTSPDVPTFKIDDELTIEFTLDDEHLSEIKKEAVVMDVRPRSVGCEFPGGGDYAYDGPLGFYIRT